MAEAKAQFNWTWEGTDKKGNRIAGKSVAPDENAVKAELRRQGVVPLKVSKHKKVGGMGGKPIQAGDIAIFARQLATMMKAGVPLVQSFDIVGKGHSNARVQQLLTVR